MENIFNRKIIFLRRKRINFNNSLYLKIEEIIVDELSDYFFIFGKSDTLKNMLLLNSENDNFNYEIFNNIKINKFVFLENDLENIELLNNFNKTDLIVGINSFHNVNYLENYFSAINKSLNSGGTFCGNFFGNGNLSELKKIIIQNDVEFSSKVFSHFNPTISPESVVSILQKFNFQNITLSSEKINFEFNFRESLNFLKKINERNYFSQMQKYSPSRKIFTQNIPEKITLDFDIIKFYCNK